MNSQDLKKQLPIPAEPHAIELKAGNKYLLYFQFADAHSQETHELCERMGKHLGEHLRDTMDVQAQVLFGYQALSVYEMKPAFTGMRDKIEAYLKRMGLPENYGYDELADGIMEELSK